MAFELIGNNYSYPIANQTNVPVGEEIKLLFNREVDEKTVKDNVVIYGPDFDRTSGPDNAVLLSNRSGENPLFLKSPHFNGFIDFDVKILKTDNDDPYDVVDPQVERIERTAGDQFCYAILTPKKALAENSEYKVFVIGENTNLLAEVPAGLQDYLQERGMSERTIYSPYSLVNNVNTYDQRVSVGGIFNEDTDRILNIKITTAGNGSEAKYVWWYNDEDEPVPGLPARRYRHNRCVSRWRGTDRGVYIKFNGGEFQVDDLIQIKVYAKVNLDNSYHWKFTTSDSSIYQEPEAKSTSPIDIPEANEAVGNTVEQLKILSVEPYDGAVNLSLNTKRIIVTFNKNINEATVTQETVKLSSYPVSGTFDGPYGTRSNREYKIFKIISITDNKMTLEL